MNSRIFETWIETQLVPTLSPGDVVILDNVGFHKSERAEQLVKAEGAWLLFLPPYSPDLNPIEMAFSKLERFLVSLNLLGFPNQVCSDSLVLAGWRPASYDRTVIE